MKIVCDSFESPIGVITAHVANNALIHLDFEDCSARTQRLLRRRFGDIQPKRTDNPLDIRDRIAGYFAGDWRAFENLELESGGTEFQREVWAELRRIPLGQAISYADLAQSIQRPAAVRAVARANALNPIAIIVPCHRVIGKDGTLTGYAGGLKRKEWLLRHEGALLV
ncbi:MAG: methylated-DNA--[protein]-cysteine S-methyltransferase [Alphaproteobacteria bacterium]|nr:methylated-DNA--[protein]-cysteine S-methyltransferase [Alphaproteobacteria bacterium]